MIDHRLDLIGALDLLRELTKPLIITLPDGRGQAWVRYRFDADNKPEPMVDVRAQPQHTWVPIQLCGGSLEVRDE